MNRRTFSRLAAATAAATLAPGTRHAFAEDVELSMWAWPITSIGPEEDKRIWNEFAKAFAEKNPGTTVKVEVLPWDGRDEKISTALASETTPDVMYLNEFHVAQLGPDYLIPFEAEDLTDTEDIAANIRDTLSLDGNLYIAPFLASVTAVAYNTKLFADLGIEKLPETWDELTEVAPTFKDAGAYVTRYAAWESAVPNLTFYPLVWQAGGQVLNEDNSESLVNSEAGVRALTWVTDLLNNGWLDKDMTIVQPPEGVSAFADGKVGLAMTIEPFQVRADSEKLGLDNIKIGPPLTDQESISYGTSAGFGIFKASKHVEQAKAWVRFITEKEQLETILTAGGYLPTRTSMADLYNDDPVLSEFMKYLDRMHGGIKHRNAVKIDSLVAPAVQTALLGEATPEEALATLAEDMNRLLK